MVNQKINKILTETRRLLAFHRSLGIENYPLDPDLSAFLGRERGLKDEGGPAGDGEVVSRQSGGPGPARPGVPALHEIETELGDCRRCRLHEHRSGIVFGQGSAEAALLLVGEWPREEDERTGKPFSGASGELLVKMLQAINLAAEDVYLTSIVKCRPPDKLSRSGIEARTCLPFLLRQIESIAPAVVCGMGPFAAQVLLDSDRSLFQLRGRSYQVNGRWFVPTFHPSFLLKNEDMKKAAWFDLRMIRRLLDKS